MVPTTVLATASKNIARSALLASHLGGVQLAARALRGRLTEKGAALIYPGGARGSLGDEAMLRACMTRLAEEGFAKISILQTEPGEDWGYLAPYRLHDLSGFRRAPLALMAFMRLIPRYERFYVLGADVMDGYYAREYSLLRVWLCRYAHQLGVETAILGFSFCAGFDPAVAAAMAALPEAVRLNVRDPTSLERMRQAMSRRLDLVADTAFLLAPEPADQPEIEALVSWLRNGTEGGVTLGFNVNMLAYKDYLRDISRERVLDAHVQAILNLGRLVPGLRALIIPHDYRRIGPVDSDLNLARELFARIEAQRPGLARCADAPLRAGQVKTLCSHLDGLVSGRMHCAIAALGVGVPVLCVAYQGKFEGLFRHFGLPPRTLDPVTSVDPEALTEQLVRFVASLDVERATVAERLPDVLRMAGLNFSDTR